MKSFELVAEMKRLLAGKRLDPEERELIMGPLELAEHVAHRRFREGLELADRLIPVHPDPGLRLTDADYAARRSPGNLNCDAEIAPGRGTH